MKDNKLFVPAAIVLAGLLISGAVIYSLGGGFGLKTGSEIAAVAKTGSSDGDIEPASDDDHVLGSLSAPIKIIEYSDAECPFCKQFHQVMHQVVTDYDGQVAWIYRHFPLPQIHPKAVQEAEATECAAELGGNDAFWAYLDRIFEITPSNNGLDLALLPKIAEYIGLDKNEFQKCLDERRHAQRVADNYNEAVESGGRGTPYSIIIAPDGQRTTIPGALPYSSIKTLVDTILGQKSE